MTITKGQWPDVRPRWKGHIPKIFGGRSTEAIFKIACSRTGATIQEMLLLRTDKGKPFADRKKALIKLLKEIKSAYCVKLIEVGDKYQFQPDN